MSSKHKKHARKSNEITLSDDTYVKEHGGIQDLFINNITLNPRRMNTSSYNNIDCVNCKRCVNCKYCVDCKNCIGCVNCVGCENCSNCKNKRYEVNLMQ